MNILICTTDFYPNIGGVATHIVELGKAFVELGHTVHVIAQPNKSQQFSSEESMHGMHIHRPNLNPHGLFYAIRMRKYLKQFIAKHNMEIMHVHTIRSLKASKGMAIPVVFTNHTSTFLKRADKGGKLVSDLLNRMSHLDHVLAPSQELVDVTKQVGYKGSVKFISNGVDIERFTPGASKYRNEWNCDDDTTVILLARRLTPKNGIICFAQAMAHFETDKKYKVVIAGTGKIEKQFKEIIEQSNNIEHFIFMGDVPNEEMQYIYRAADISMLPSLMEATSITGLESMATALPLIGSNIGGIPHLITHEKTGLLIEPSNPEKLREAINQLVENPELRKNMGANARKKVEKQFSWLTIAQETVNEFNDVLESK